MITDNEDTPEKTPFQVVLVDLKKAAYESEILCVEKPLMGSGDLKFIAVSYRWGELLETSVDTGLGYVASIKSFDLDSLFLLCRAILKETDLKLMQYLWVDAICVDQNNYGRRKATIYQMNNIYHRANYIVAVPDLHLGHLREVNKNNADIIRGSGTYGEYIYHLIHHNKDKLRDCDTAFLDTHGVPTDRYLRHLLTNYTDHFVEGFTYRKDHSKHYDDTITLHHIYQTNMASRVPTKYDYGNLMFMKLLTKIGHIYQTNIASRVPAKYHYVNEMVMELLAKIGYGDKADLDLKPPSQLHECDNVDACPIELFCPSTWFFSDDKDTIHQPWKRLIPERSASIRRSMVLLTDLMMDWSKRVWVISEYHMAKEKPDNKMKYWFLQLGEQPCFNEFFEIKFPTKGIDRPAPVTNRWGFIVKGYQYKSSAVSIGNSFYSAAMRQLNEQTILEMILKSNATRNEDRLYAILPLTKYKYKLTSKEQVEQWRIRDLASVKLQLYTWMDTTDRLELLFLSSRAENTAQVLPSFATSKILWPELNHYPMFDHGNPRVCNFDVKDSTCIKLLTHKGGHKLNIKPKEYYVNKQYTYDIFSRKENKYIPRLFRLIGYTTGDWPEMICIPNYRYKEAAEHKIDFTKLDGVIHYIYLIGYSRKNKWLVEYHKTFDHHDITDTSRWIHYDCHENKAYTGFDIY